MDAGFWLRSAGYPLASVAPHGDVSTTWTYGDDGGGLGEVSWSCSTSFDQDHPALRQGALVQVMDGGLVAGVGTLAEPGRTEDGRTFVAQGAYNLASRLLCFDAAGQTTTIPDVAVDQAAIRCAANGAPVLTRNGSLTGEAIKTDSVTDGLNYLSDLLTALAVETSKRWWVDGDLRINLAPDPTAPTWHLIPGVVDPAPVTDDYAPSLYGRYRTGVSLATINVLDEPASQRWGYSEYGVDLTGFGSISAARASNRLNGLLARGKSRLTWAEAITVNSHQLLTVGGLPAPLSSVRAGQVVRCHGLAAYSQWLDGNPWMDVVLGEVTWANGADTITLAPVNVAASSYEGLLTEALASTGLKP